MYWLVFAILAPIVYTIVNFTDKFVVAKAIPDARSVPIFLAIVHGVISLLLWMLNGFPVLAFDVALPLMATGALVIIGTFMLFRALIVAETSKIVMWTQMLPVVVLIMSLLVLNEQLNLMQIIGFFIIFFATVGLSFEPNSFRITPAFLFIMIAVVVWSASDILLKLILNHNPTLLGNSAELDISAFLNVIIYQSAGFAIGGLIVYLTFPNIRHTFNHRMQIAPPYALAVLFVNETVFILRQFLRSLAIALGPVALVSVLGGTRIFLGIVVGWLLTLFAPQIFEEDISREGLQRKFIFSCILFVGILVLSFAEIQA